MATRVLQKPKILQNLRQLARPLNSAPSSFSAAVSPLNFVDKPEPAAVENPPPPTKPTTTNPSSSSSSTLDLHDHQKLFETLSTFKLLRASTNLHLAAIEPVVDLGMWVMKSKLIDINIVRDIILGTVKHTFFEHFCAGETQEEAGECIKRINEAGLRAMLVYAVEHTAGDSTCDRNLEGFLETIKLATSLPPSSVGCVVVKLTAIFPTAILHRVSDLLRWQYKDPSLNLPWKLNTFPIFAESSPLYHTQKKPDPLNAEESQQLELGYQRLFKIYDMCAKAGVPLTIDAEDTYLQPAIDYLTYSTAILRNNGDDKPVVYTTIQTYLKDAMERLEGAVKTSEILGVPMGFKLVRGAYMSSERKLAASMGYESPIHNCIQDTHNCFNTCASFLLERIANGYNGGVILATHNVESGQLAAAKARDLGIENGSHRLEFAQLYGMSDALSFSLKNAGFNVSKYMPYGPVDKVIPYLLRRAEENRGLLAASSLDRELLRMELMRRIKNLEFLKTKMTDMNTIKLGNL